MILLYISSTKDDYLEIKFTGRNQTDGKFALGQGGGSLSFQQDLFTYALSFYPVIYIICNVKFY